jgi:hypothetical protein
MSHDLAAINSAYRLGCRSLLPIGSVVEWFDQFGVYYRGNVHRYVHLHTLDKFVMEVSLSWDGGMLMLLTGQQGFKVLHVPDDAPSIEEWKGSEL